MDGGQPRSTRFIGISPIGVVLITPEMPLEEFNSEKEIVELCGQRNMRRIVRASVAKSDDDQVIVALSCLHHMPTALHELHFSTIAHQNPLAPVEGRPQDD